MSQHQVRIAPQFFVTAPQPCPYLDGRFERKLFTTLRNPDAATINDMLSLQGFRRSQGVVYRPSCADCSACLSTRVPVDAFQPTKTQKRILRRNRDLVRHAAAATATETQYELFRDYLDARHAKGGMAEMDVFEFAAMIEETPVRTRVVEYTCEDEDGDEELIAACLTDVLSDGLSMVYSFFAPEQDKRSLGVYMILDHIEIAKRAGLPYVYLGYWVPGSQKMGYKSSFRPFEIFQGNAWRRVDDPDDMDLSTAEAQPDSVADQVARLMEG